MVGRGLLLVLALGVAGCEAPGAPGAPAAQAAQKALSLSAFSLRSKYLVGAEMIDADVTLGGAGSGTVTAYGLSTRLGAKVYTLDAPLPVVEGGKLVMHVGPLPNLTEAGPLDVQFWLIDSAGASSNRLTASVVVQ